MSPAPSVYPAALDDFVTNKVGTDPKTGHADVHNMLGAAIEGMQAEMGTNPSGSWATLRARLDYLWDETDVPVGGDVLTYDAGTGKFSAAKMTNATIDSSASIGIAKLAGYPGDSTKWLRGDGLWQALPESASVPTGTVFATMAAAAPSGYILAHGQELLRSTYAALDAIVGTQFGAYTNGAGGPGTTHFRIADLRGRAVFGVSPGGAANVNVMGGNDGRPNVYRSPSHRHSICEQGAGGWAQIMAMPITNRAYEYNGVWVWTSGDANNNDSPAFQALNYIVKT